MAATPSQTLIVPWTRRVRVKPPGLRLSPHVFKVIQEANADNPYAYLIRESDGAVGLTDPKFMVDEPSE